MIKIRLSKVGSKKSKVVRIVAIDARKKRGGQAKEVLGLIEKGAIINLNKVRLAYWIEKGAQTSLAVKKLLKE